MIEQVKIAITLTDGTLIIKSFVTNDYHGYQKEPTEQNVNAEIQKSGYAVQSWRFISDDEIIEDRTYRNAWKDTGRIEVDVPKAIEVHKDMLRVQRAFALEKLDVEYTIADEAKNTKEKTRIAKEKQRLRDITALPALVNAATVDDLKKITINSV